MNTLTKATEPLAKTTEPLAKTTEPLAKTTEPLAKTTGAPTKITMSSVKIHKKQQIIIRAVIQIIFFIASAAAFTSAFSGIKYIFIQLGKHEPIELNAFVLVLIGVCAYSILFGRFFCGYICAFGSLGDLLYEISVWIQKRMKKRFPNISANLTGKLIYCKSLLLIAILLLCFTDVYQTLVGVSPWDVFSMITAGNLKLESYTVGIILLALILLGMCVEDRFFCKFLSPWVQYLLSCQLCPPQVCGETGTAAQKAVRRVRKSAR